MREVEVLKKTVGGASVLPLPARLDLTAAGPLRDEFLSRRGTSLSIDAGLVEHLGTPCLQVLLAAASEWRAHRQQFDVTSMSEAFSDALRSFGLTPGDLAAHGPGQTDGVDGAEVRTSWA